MLQKVRHATSWRSRQSARLSMLSGKEREARSVRPEWPRVACQTSTLSASSSTSSCDLVSVDSTAGEQGRLAAGRTYIAGIDGLRAVAVLSVLLYHVDEHFLPGGFVGVDLFFVISGFVVSMATSNVRARGLGQLLLTFYRRRVVRILPAALIFLLLAQLAAVLFVPVKDRLTVPDMTASAATAGLSNIVLWLKAGDYFSPGAALNPFTHTWSLAVEEQFYILFPFFAFLIWVRRSNLESRRWGTVGIAICSAISLIIAARLTQSDRSFAFYMLPTRFWELAAGMLLFIGIERNSRSSYEPRFSNGLVNFFSFLAVSTLFSTFMFVKSDNFPFPNALAPVLAATLLIFISSAAPGAHLSRVLSMPPLRYFGRISFSLYLWHWGVIVLMLWTVGLEALPQKVAAVLISIALADLSYRLIERPVRGSTWLAKRPDWQIVTAGVAGIVAASLLIGGLTALRPWLTRSVTGNLDVWLPSAPGSGGRCKAERAVDAFPGDGRRYVFEPRDCQGLTDSRHLYVVGDSHAWAYQRLIGNIVRNEGLAATIYMATGCTVVPADGSELTARKIEQSASSQCATFVDQSFAAVANSAKPGDILFLPGLRMQRYREYWEPELRISKKPETYNDSMVATEARRLSFFINRGMRVILEAPKPVYKLAPMRCSDWFNKSNPHCRAMPTTASELQPQRNHVLDLFAKIRGREPRVEVWDPFPLLCPGETCPAVLDGKPIVSDGDHLSGYANDYLSPSLWDVLSRP
jgi:peptidoglycan/LPS O-acetylase OafA/YrhL